MPLAQTTAGVWIGVGPRRRLSISSTDQALGEAVLDVLSHSHGPVDHPTEWKNLFQPMLELAGVRSLKEFDRGTTVVTVGRTDENIELTPNRQIAPGKGYLPRNDEELRLPVDASATTIGEAVQRLACIEGD
jgi:hypothetical protein